MEAEGTTAMSYIEIGSAAISVLALVLSFLALGAAKQANRVGIFRERLAVYKDAEDFIKGWNQKGSPDMSRLQTLVAAWDRSHFLFDSKVTSHLREIWLDAVSADYASKIIAGEVDGERAKAIETSHTLFLKHGEYEKLRDAFKEMKVR